MDRFYLLIMCASIVLLTAALGVASPQADGGHSPEHVPLFAANDAALTSGGAELSGGHLCDLFGIVSSCGIDLDDLARDDLANWVVTINQTQGAQGERKGSIEPLDRFRLDLAFPEKPIDRHRSPP
jgi:hypothetical protein